MFETTIAPRMNETDALGHISNTVMPIWFEVARQPIFEIVHPSQTLAGWPLIVARIEVDYVGQIFPGSDVQIRTAVARIGTSSFTTYQEAWQAGQLVAKGYVVHVYFDYQKKQSTPLPENVAAELRTHILETAQDEAEKEAR